MTIDDPITPTKPVSDWAVTAVVIEALGRQFVADSEHWFPAAHDRDSAAIVMHFALGLGGETGEVLDVIKKADLCGLTESCPLHADGKHSREALASELADVFTYLLALASVTGVDLVAAYQAKRLVNTGRWGSPS